MNRQIIAERCAKLAARMAIPVKWAKAPRRLPGAEAPIGGTPSQIRDNPFIPAGYTHLLELVAHDMVATRVPFWATTQLDQDTANDRGARLLLEALYGAGPNVSRLIYAPDGPDTATRTRLQVGRACPLAHANGPPVAPFRDIARLRLRDTLADLPGRTEPLIADPRNDDHPLISQLTMVFCHLHNLFVARQAPAPADATPEDATRMAAERFAKARLATTIVYRHVVREDLLRRLLHPRVYALYASGQMPLLDLLAGARNSGVPLEFSHAAMRIGHVMVRGSYRINDASPEAGLLLADGLDNFSSVANPAMTGLPGAWLVKWSNFFQFPGITDPARLNLSRRIGPEIPDFLASSRFPAIDPARVEGLTYRDLVSGELANLWPIQDLLGAMWAHDAIAPILDESNLLRNDRWQLEIMNWLEEGEATSVWGDKGQTDDDAFIDDIAHLAVDPPLLFFVLFEAYCDPESQGCRLGRAGSVLFAEALFGELNNKLPPEQQPGTLAERLASINPHFADAAFEDAVTMATVIGFIDRHLQASPDPAMRFPPLV